VRRFFNLLTFAAVALLLAGGGVLWWAAKRASRVPKFYEDAAARMPHDVPAASQQLQKQVIALQERVQRRGDWFAVFSEPQINAWLNHDLAHEFPRVLPPGVESPRVVMEEDRLRVAARYRNKHFDWIISFCLQARLTDQPNVLAIEVSDLRAGDLRLPIANFRHHISNAAAKGQLEVRWSEEDGDPIALVTIPSDHQRYVSKPVIIERLDVLDGELQLSGHTGPHALQVFSPQGPIFRIASIVLTATLQ
jgi:hypothetical protein